jgi:hypothetical protein
MGSLWQIGGEQIACGCWNIECGGFQMRDTELQIQAMHRHHGKLELAAFDLRVDVFHDLGGDIEEEPLIAVQDRKFPLELA